MKLHRPISLAILLLIAAGTCHARIGETLAQCTARYGPEVSPTKHRIHFFHKNGFSIAVIIESDRAVALTIRKLPGSSTEEITPTQIQSLLTSNAAGRTWEKATDSTDETQHWTTTDGTLHANYLTDMHTLLIITAAEKNRNLQAKDQQEKAEVSGF